MKTLPTQLTDSALINEVKRLARCEREATAALVAHLAEMEGRKLFCAEGCGSLFAYCTQILLLSENASYRRVEAARMVRLFPSILAALEVGALHLTSIRLLAPHLTDENCAELIDAARHRSKREIEQFLARRFPRPGVPAIVRKLPARAREATAPMGARHEMEARGVLEARVATDGHEMMQTCATMEAAPGAALATAVSDEVRRSVVEPLAPGRYKVQFTVSAATHERLRRAQDLLRHRIPDGDLSQVFDLALTMLVERLEKQKFAATDRVPASHGRSKSGSVPAPGSRVIPAAVKRAAWQRDEGRCAFIATNGRRCTEVGFLEFHHVVPFARGGNATAENIALRCRAHNQYEAILEFGPRDTHFVREAGAPWPGCS